MDDQWRIRLKSEMPSLTQRLNPLQMLQHLTSLSKTTSEQIKCDARNDGDSIASMTLINAVCKHTDFTYKEFIKGLLEHDRTFAFEFDKKTCDDVEREMVEKRKGNKHYSEANRTSADQCGANMFNISHSNIQIGDANQQHLSGPLNVHPEIRRTISTSLQTNLSSSAVPVQENSSQKPTIYLTSDQTKICTNNVVQSLSNNLSKSSQITLTESPNNITSHASNVNGRDRNIPVEDDENTEPKKVATSNFVDESDSSNDSEPDCPRVPSNDKSVEVPVCVRTGFAPGFTSVNLTVNDDYPADNYSAYSSATTDSTSTDGTCSSSCLTTNATQALPSSVSAQFSSNGNNMAKQTRPAEHNNSKALTVEKSSNGPKLGQYTASSSSKEAQYSLISRSADAFHINDELEEDDSMNRKGLLSTMTDLARTCLSVYSDHSLSIPP